MTVLLESRVSGSGESDITWLQPVGHCLDKLALLYNTSIKQISHFSLSISGLGILTYSKDMIIVWWL